MTFIHTNHTAAFNLLFFWRSLTAFDRRVHLDKQTRPHSLWALPQKGLRILVSSGSNNDKVSFIGIICVVALSVSLSLYLSIYICCHVTQRGPIILSPLSLWCFTRCLHGDAFQPLLLWKVPPHVLDQERGSRCRRMSVRVVSRKAPHIFITGWRGWVVGCKSKLLFVQEKWYRLRRQSKLLFVQEKWYRLRRQLQLRAPKMFASPCEHWKVMESRSAATLQTFCNASVLL